MSADMPNAGRPAYYTVRQAARILGVQPSTVSRALRRGTLRAVRRHGQLVVSVTALTRLLGAPTGNDPQATCDGGGESR
ncbi:MAG: helix-turn-helix domain-containing protein [Pseudonocardiales bacterium]|nr:helix-turn-helix domain-containing protein [Pseudonocardiales bacterium]